MSQLQTVRDRIPDFGRDIRLNLEAVLNPEGTAVPGLAPAQAAAVGLACAYSVREQSLADALIADFQLPAEVQEAAKGASVIMAMNNVYYRTMHLLDDKEIAKLPAKLRMNIIGKPGIPKVDFELMSLAVSAIAGCGACINSHVHEVKKQGITDEGAQSAIRIASVVNAAKQALSLKS